MPILPEGLRHRLERGRQKARTLLRRGRDGASATEAGITTRHPILQVLDTRSEQISTFIQNADAADRPTRATLVTQEMSAIADELVSAGPFTLTPDNLPEIWQDVLTVFGPRMDMRCGLARVVAAAYSIQDTTDPRWRNFPRQYNEIRQVPEVAAEDQAGSKRVAGRIQEILSAYMVIKNSLTAHEDDSGNLHQEHDPSDSHYVRMKLIDDFGNTVTPIKFAIVNLLV